ncbi:DNA/RNA nuclease SfsA [Marinobacter nanhaiticus D15-8W]|uniref:Sugar fermentation stimulation protein homolog n=1 Tax=Marinobacter nanhaiticus D15-8W TaxID=626887 RepID=N6VWC3_9GAMM|nr:DNA/RNA nuclease SfsA [Marinobacter nanhaiticus]ENO14555.1 DNA/RNA nuclease SfsA [Marinobacter nanhaiticus D15-8W]BES69805.1 DNA/RNA nuclease SfsA [Marinobacter nanhaiticus D15-8W]
MQFPVPLVEGRLIKRYKRFLADVELADGSVVTAHCPNTGSMLGCNAPQSRVWLSESADPKRKLKFTWELVETGPEQLALINTARPNRQARAAIEAGLVPSLAGYGQVRSEVKYGSEKSRIDLHLSGHPEQPDAWVEVKNVTLCEDGKGFFPDAVTTRGQKHLRELQAQAAIGERAVLFFCVNHTAVSSVAPADHIDATYGSLLREAVAGGVEVMAWQAALSPEGLALVRELPVLTD